jgi:hypothetical protein
LDGLLGSPDDAEKVVVAISASEDSENYVERNLKKDLLEICKGRKKRVHAARF